VKAFFELALEDWGVSFNIFLVNFVSIAVEEETNVTNKS
jgi:hypothetical protein